MEERRSVHRYRLPLAVELRLLPKGKVSELIQARTRDVSTHGLYFTSGSRLAVGTRFALSLTLPTEASISSHVTIDAEAKVVRVEANSENVVERVGIAAVIESYNVVRPKSAKFR